MLLILYRSELRNESRIERSAEALLQAGLFQEITAAGTNTSGLPEQDLRPCGLRLHRFPFPPPTLYLWGRRRQQRWSNAVVSHYARRPGIDCVSAHSWTVLPMTVKIAAANGCPWIYEPHELETDTSDLGWRGRIRARKTESQYIRAAAAVVVVSDCIADWYEQRYQIPRPTVVRNIPRLARHQPVPGRCLRRILKIPQGDLIFLYQGLLIQKRGVERLLEIFKSGETSRHLVFLGNGPLSQTVEAASRKYSNIHRLPAVPFEELLDYTSSADIGIASIQNSCLSYYYSLPNKLFEYIQAGIPVLASDFPEMRAVIERFRCGWVAPDNTAAWKQAIHSISIGAVQEAKRQALKAAREFSWEEEAAKLVSVYQRLTLACIAPASTARGLRGEDVAGGGSKQNTDRQKSDISSP